MSALFFEWIHEIRLIIDDVLVSTHSIMHTVIDDRHVAISTTFHYIQLLLNTLKDTSSNVASATPYSRIIHFEALVPLFVFARTWVASRNLPSISVESPYVQTHEEGMSVCVLFQIHINEWITIEKNVTCVCHKVVVVVVVTIFDVCFVL